MGKKFVFGVVLIAVAVFIGCGGGAHHLSSGGVANSAARPLAVTLESPSLGTAQVPLAVQASATTMDGVSGWIVYVDDRIAYQVNDSSTALAASVPVSSGAHKLYVRVWDQSSNFATTPIIQLNVEGQQATVSEAASNATQPAPPAAAPSSPAPPPKPQPPPPGPLPSIPGNAKTWNNIQNMGAWESCSACAGGNPTSNFWTASNQSSPSLSGSSREFYVGGGGWSNALWFNKVGPGYTWASHFLWDFWVRFDGTSAAHAHSAEYDIWQVISGREYMIGSQCNFASGVWDVWNSQSFQWKPTGISCHRFSPDTWHHIQWYVERQGSNYHYGVLVVDGNAHTLDRTYTTDPVGRDDSVGVQFQLDEDQSGTPLHEWIDKVQLSVW